MDLLIIALYLTVSLLITLFIDWKWEELSKEFNFIIPLQVYVTRAMLFALAVFWPVFIVLGIAINKKNGK